MARSDKTQRRNPSFVVKDKQEQERAAYLLKMGGRSVHDIAKEMNVTDSAVGLALRKTMQEIDASYAETISEARRLDLDRLDALLAGLWDKACRGDTQACDRVLKILERRAKIIGSDAPTAVAVSSTDAAMTPPVINIVDAQPRQPPVLVLNMPSDTTSTT